MKATTFCLIIIVCNGCYAKNNHAIVFDDGMIIKRGAVSAAEITASTCSVAVGGEISVVDMGKFKSNQFDGVGSYSPPVTFNMTFSDCLTTVSNNVGVAFLGQPDSRDPVIFQVDVGRNSVVGVGLAIFDSTENLIVLNALPLSVAHLYTDDTSLRFIARYRATSNSIIEGNANTWAWFALSYQ